MSLNVEVLKTFLLSSDKFHDSVRRMQRAPFFFPDVAAKLGDLEISAVAEAADFDQKLAIAEQAELELSQASAKNPDFVQKLAAEVEARREWTQTAPWDPELGKKLTAKLQAKNDLEQILDQFPELAQKLGAAKQSKFDLNKVIDEKAKLDQTLAAARKKAFGDRKEAAAKRISSIWIFSGFVSGSALIVLGFVIWLCQPTIKAAEKDPKTLWEYIQRSILALLGADHKLLPTDPLHISLIVFIVVGILILLATLVIWFLELPMHQADPLFARLLQEELETKSVPSDSYIRSLLGDTRFGEIFRRATLIVFPLRTKSDLLTFPWPEQRIAPQVWKESKEWEDLVDRLLDRIQREITNKKGTPFGRFLANHTARLTSDHYEDQLEEFVTYTMRQLLFEQILSDPDFASLYGTTSRLWRGILHWTRTVDLKKLSEFWPKSGESKGGPDKQTLLAYVAIILLLFAILQKPIAPSPPSRSGDNAKPTDVIVRADMSEFSEQLTKLISKLCQQCPAHQPTAAAPVYVSVPASPGPVINLPPTTFPSKIDVAMTSNVDPAETQIQQNINFSTANGKNDGHTQNPKPPNVSTNQPSTTQPTMYGDTLVSFIVSDRKSKKNTSLNTDFDLLSPSGSACQYHAVLPFILGKWPPGPIQVTVSVRAGMNLPSDCPQIPAVGAVVSVSNKPLYNSALKAYVSLDERHSHYLFFGGSDQIVILIHYPPPTFN